jgi:hypothetical protein
MAAGQQLQCQKCFARVRPSAIDLLPSPSGFASVDCLACGNSNRIPYPVSFSFNVLAIALSFPAAIVAFDKLGLPAWLAAIGAVAGMVVLNALFLSLYFAHSKRPFVRIRVGR